MAAGFKEFFDLLSPKTILLMFCDIHDERRAQNIGKDLDTLLDKISRYINRFHFEYQNIATDIANGKLCKYKDVLSALELIDLEEEERTVSDALRREIDRMKQCQQEEEREKEEREMQLREEMKKWVHKRSPNSMWEDKADDDDFKYLFR